MAEYHLTLPLKNEDIEKLQLGDTVYITGEVFTCRSRLQKYIFDEGHTLPFSTADRNVLIHNGPIVIKENGKWKLMSFMPTSSIRFEKWGAKSVDEWGLKMIVGKTTMGEETAKMQKTHEYDVFFSFNQALGHLQGLMAELGQEQTIVLVVDELDRCLPEYSIKVL